MLKEEKEILAFEENPINLRDFEEKEDLLVENALEKFSFLKEAQQSKVMISFFLHEINDKKFDNWVKFSSYLYVDKKDNLEIEINKKFYRNFQHPCIWGVMILNNIKVVFESQITNVNLLSSDILGLTVGMPFRMIRYQRREAFRVKVPPFAKINIDLDNNPELPHLKNLKLLNLSVSGAAVLLNTNQDINLLPKDFPNATIILEDKIFSNIRMKVKRVEPFNRDAIPLNLAAQREQLGWYELAVSFEKLPTKALQELFFTVNMLAKKNQITNQTP